MPLTTIQCPNCRNSISIDEVLTKQIETQVQTQYEAKYNHDIEVAKKGLQDQARREAIDKVRQEYLVKIETTKEESLAREKQNQELQEQVKQLLKQIREERDLSSKKEIEYEKKLLDEQERIKQQAKAEAVSELELRLAEKDKKLADAVKANEDLRKKLEQGSQQLQGEIQELHLKELLSKEFPHDDIADVPKGVNGADLIQHVNTRQGAACGTIIWESKNTKHWSPSWVQKLKDDQRFIKADIAVIVSSVLPESTNTISIVDGVIVSSLHNVIPLAYLLRQQLIQLQATFLANQHKASKAEVVYNYLISTEFKQRIEVWVEYVLNRRVEVEKERAYFMKKWEREDKLLLGLLSNTSGIYGDLQGLMGNALPKISKLELSSGL